MEALLSVAHPRRQWAVPRGRVCTQEIVDIRMVADEQWQGGRTFPGRRTPGRRLGHWLHVVVRGISSSVAVRGIRRVFYLRGEKNLRQLIVIPPRSPRMGSREET